MANAERGQPPKESNTASTRNEITAPPCGSLDLLPPCVGQKGLDVARQNQKEEHHFFLGFLLSSFTWLMLKTHPAALPTLMKAKKLFRKDGGGGVAGLEAIPNEYPACLQTTFSPVFFMSAAL